MPAHADHRVHQSQGGVGKTTAALLLASQLARGAKVSVIDADPNHPIAFWAKGTALPGNLSIIADVDQDTILDGIEEAAPQRLSSSSIWKGQRRRSCCSRSARPIW